MQRTIIIRYSAAAPTLRLLLDLATLQNIQSVRCLVLLTRQLVIDTKKSNLHLASSMLGAECRTGIVAAPRIGYSHQLRHSSILLRLGRPTANDATWQPRSVDVWLYARAAKPPQPRGWPQPRLD